MSWVQCFGIVAVLVGAAGTIHLTYSSYSLKEEEIKALSRTYWGGSKDLLNYFVKLKVNNYFGFILLTSSYMISLACVLMGHLELKFFVSYFWGLMYALLISSILIGGAWWLRGRMYLDICRRIEKVGDE